MPLRKSHQTPLGSLLPDRVNCRADYHVHGSLPESHIKQRSRLPGFGLWFSHGLAGFISWAGGRIKRDGSRRLWERERPLEHKVLSTFWTWPQESSPKWVLQVKSPLPLWARWRRGWQTSDMSFMVRLEKGEVDSTWRKIENHPQVFNVSKKILQI